MRKPLVGAGLVLAVLLGGCGLLPTATQTVTVSPGPGTSASQPPSTPPTPPPSPTAVPPTTSSNPPEPSESSVEVDARLITVDGVGGIRLGMTGPELGSYVAWGTTDCGFSAYKPTARLGKDYPGLLINYVERQGGIDWILIKDTTQPYRTATGARLGTTVTALKQMYGTKLIKISGQGAGEAYEVRQAEQSIVFSVWEASKVGSILVRYMPLWPEPC